MIVITESGSNYRIQDGFWSRNGESRERIVSFRSVPEDAKTWQDVRDADIPAPRVGYRMFLSNFDVWRVSTPVVRILNEDDDE